MAYLLDTHVILWWLSEPEKLSQTVQELLTQDNNLIFISAASLWEIEIKVDIGKLTLPKKYRSILDTQGFEWLDIAPKHTDRLPQLPLHHRDPFDRMLIVQAQVEDLILITKDKNIKLYNVNQVW